MTVAELIEKLKTMPQDKQVETWLPGSHIDIVSVFDCGDRVLMEGEINDDPRNS